MVRALGAVMAGMSCAYMGFRLSLTQKKRVESLCNIITSLEMLEGEIGFSALRLADAFARSDRNGLFTVAAEGIEEKGVKRAWSEAVGKEQGRLCLTDADCDALLMLGDGIGRTDTENQLKHIRYVKSAVTGQRDAAQTDYDRFGRVYRSGGILAGLLTIIVLF